MANIDIISKTPDSLLPEIIPTTIFQWQNCSIFGGNIDLVHKKTLKRIKQRVKPGA